MKSIRSFLVFAVSASAVFSLGSCCAQSNPPISSQVQTQSVSCPEITSDLMKSYFIEPGIGVGNFKLGITIENITEIAKKRCLEPFAVYYPNFEYMDAMLSARDENVSNMTGGDGIRCYFKNNALFQISVDSYLYSTDELITKNSLLGDVKRKYPGGKAFRLMPSKKSVTQKVEKLSYWVVTDDGIAFEFYPSPEKIMRVSNIYVFRRQTEFIPLSTRDSPEFFELVIE